MSAQRPRGFEDVPTRLREQGPAPATGDELFELVVVQGPDTSKRFRFDEAHPRALVGKGPSCELHLTDPMVSRRHAQAELQGRSVRWTDLSSTNGSRINRLAVYDVALCGGERIELGETVLEVQKVRGDKGPPAPQASGFGRLVGQSLPMRQLYPLCERLAGAQVPVIIEGETGTGKEVLAESLHERGPRAAGPFVVLDCTAVASTLLESTLFGHERGSFTGAVGVHRGVFEEAHGGTLLIDEIGDLDLALQAKLLRALERSEVRRLGGDRWIKVDVRVMAATRRDLDQEVQAGRFRDDLFFRIAVGRIELPALRRRREDIPLLVQHFWKGLGGQGAPSPELLERLQSRPWPGNVRELYNAVARQLALGDLTAWDAAPERTQPNAAAPAGDALAQVLELELPLPRSRELVVEEFERRYVARILEKHGGNVSRAAAASGLGRRYFQLIKARQGR